MNHRTAHAQPTAPEPAAHALTLQAELAVAERDWPTALDAARRSNLILFSSNSTPSNSDIARNYHLAAQALLNLREFHEAMILANLCLKTLPDDSDNPSKTAVGLLLARTAVSQKDWRLARETLEALGALPTTPTEAAEAVKLAGQLPSH